MLSWASSASAGSQGGGGGGGGGRGGGGSAMVPALTTTEIYRRQADVRAMGSFKYDRHPPALGTYATASAPVRRRAIAAPTHPAAPRADHGLVHSLNATGAEVVQTVAQTRGWVALRGTVQQLVPGRALLGFQLTAPGWADVYVAVTATHLYLFAQDADQPVRCRARVLATKHTDGRPSRGADDIPNRRLSRRTPTCVADTRGSLRRRRPTRPWRSAARLWRSGPS